MDSKYDSIRPYSDLEAVEAMKRIALSPQVGVAAGYLGMAEEVLREKLGRVGSIDAFQSDIMADVIRTIIDKTTSGVNYSGIEKIKNGRKHILLSNHRDIILDPAIIQLILFDNDVSTTEIAVGDNLIANSFVEDVFRSNRMIKVSRGGTPREKYVFSTLLSSYLREAVAEERCSVWIAQRNGRSKDGKDMTEQGVLKMLDMSGRGSFMQNFKELSILPVSISYQFEPCDFLKARELYISRRKRYVKQPGEDVNSILTGVFQNKGKISFVFSGELSDAEIEAASLLDKNERFAALSNIIDEKISSGYHLWDTNFIAWDLLHDSERFSERYTADEKGSFEEYMNKGLAEIIRQDPCVESAELREIFLSIYANAICF